MKLEQLDSMEQEIQNLVMADKPVEYIICTFNFTGIFKNTCGKNC